MRKLSGILFFALLMIFNTACEFVSYEEWEMSPYTGLFTWDEITPKAEWSNRVDLAGVAFKGKIWILGGYDSGRIKGDTYLEDVWSSPDGETWTLETDEAPWHGRRGHATVVFDDGNGEAIYLIGGFEVNEETGYRQYTNDVWKSENGVDWQQIKERTYSYGDTSIVDWDPRYDHSCFVAIYDGTPYIYLIGGAAQREKYNPLYSMKYYSDVWRSSNGIDWEQLNTNDFGERAELTAAYDEQNERIYIHGGMHSKEIETENNYINPVADYDAIWYSNDGEIWHPDTSLIISRAGHDMFFFKNMLWLFPGHNTSYKKFHLAWGNVYYTYRKDISENWILDSEGSAFSGRHSYARAILNDKVYIMGGETGDNGPNNDVWCGTINN